MDYYAHAARAANRVASRFGCLDMEDVKQAAALAVVDASTRVDYTADWTAYLQRAATYAALREQLKLISGLGGGWYTAPNNGLHQAKCAEIRIRVDAHAAFEQPIQYDYDEAQAYQIVRERVQAIVDADIAGVLLGQESEVDLAARLGVKVRKIWYQISLAKKRLARDPVLRELWEDTCDCVSIAA